MKFLKDVAMKGTPSDAWAAFEGNVPVSDYGPEFGRTHCCDWIYSEHALRETLIRHHERCRHFNPDGLLEFM